VVQKIDRRVVREMHYHPSDTHEPLESLQTRPISRVRGGMTVVRDVAWNSQEPVLMTCSWAAHSRPSEVAKHEWKGLNKLGGRLEDLAEREVQEAKDRAKRFPQMLHSRGDGY
jgi:DDB1- and CUL4-associated factor 11